MSPRSTTLRAPTARNVRRRLGLTLVEATMVLAVVTLIFVGFAQLLGDASENMRIKASVDRLKEVAKASEMYIAANQKKIRENVGDADGYVAVRITGGIVTNNLISVQNAGFLPQSFTDQNSYNQSHLLYIRTLPSADTSNTKVESRRIEAIVTTVASLGAGNRIPFRQVGRAAQMLGSQGGFCRGTSPADNTCTYVVGAGGGWRVASSAIHARVGSIQAALFAGDTGFVSDYLNRNDIGDKEANTMRTTMYAAPASGQYAMEQDPNTGTTVLKIGPDVSVPGYVEAGNYVKAGTTCAETGEAGDVVACHNVRAKNDLYAEGNVVGSKFIDRNDPTRIMDPNGSSNLKTLDITDTLVTVSDGGDRLKDNASVRLRDLLPRYVAKDGFSVSKDSPYVEVPVCPNNGQARVFLSPMQDSFQFDLAKYITYQKMPGYVYNVNGATNPVQDQAVTSLQCAGDNCSYNTSAFVKPDGLTYIQGIADINVGKLSNYRQFSAKAPVYTNPPGGTGAKYYWEVNLGSAADQVGDGSLTQPLPWKALAMTYCYY